MKLRNLICLVAFATVVDVGNAFCATVVLPTSCYSRTTCRTTKPYCCPNGETDTREVCPDGWTLSSGICSRVSDDAGEDDKGYLAIEYGTCSPTEEEYDCYVGSDSSEVTIDGYTARCVTGAVVAG